MGSPKPCIHRLEWMLICQPGEIMHVLLSSNFPWLFTAGGCFSIRVSLPSLEIFPTESLRCFLLARAQLLSLSPPSPLTDPPKKFLPSITISVSAVHERDTTWIFSKLHVLKSKKNLFTVANRRGNKPFSNLQWAILKILTRSGKG